MRIKIDLEVEPEEIPMVTELVSLLRHFKSTTTTTTTVPSSSTVAPAVAAASTAAAAAIPPQQQQQPAPAVTTATTPTPVSPVAVAAAPIKAISPAPTEQPKQQAPQAPAPTAQPPTAPATLTTYRAVLSQITETEDEAADAQLHARVMAELRRIMEGTPDTAVDLFFTAFTEIALSAERVQRNVSVLPFVALLPRLPEPFKIKVRDRLLQTVLKHLTIKRPVDCNRMDFFAYAEVFAALVKVEFVNIHGAVTSITTLLQKRDTLCAGVTMLGKTVELCLNLLNEKCDAGKLAVLRRVLQHSAATDDVLRYDVTYIEENMGWTTTPTVPATPVAAAAAAVAPTLPVESTTSVQLSAAALGRLVCKNKYEGHRDRIYALCYDSAREMLVSTGKDGQVIVWNAEGKVNQRTTMTQYPCSMDINPRTKSLFICSVAREGTATGSLLTLYNTADSASEGLSVVGTIGSRINAAGGPAKMFSCVKAMVQDPGNHIATGESIGTENGYVRLYDLEASSASSSSYETMQPVVSYREHEAIITSLAHHPSAEGLLFSGSRDGTIRLWDKRSPKSAGLVGATSGLMITCLDAHGCLLASGSVDNLVRIWDLRNLATPSFAQPIDDNAVLKLAISPQSTSSTPVLAVSTFNQTKSGLYLAFPAKLQTTIATNPLEAAVAGAAVQQFFGLVWGDREDNGSAVLYAAGDDLRKYVVHWEK